MVSWGINYERRGSGFSGPASSGGGGGGGGNFQFPAGRLPAAITMNQVAGTASGLSWQPGVTYNTIPNEPTSGYTSGIPYRTTIYQTLSPKSVSASGVSGTNVNATVGTSTFTVPGGAGGTYTPVNGDQLRFLNTGGVGGISTTTLYTVTSASGSTFQLSGVTLSGSQSGQPKVVVDDGAPIQTAWNACPQGEVLKLTTGVFNVLTNIAYKYNSTGYVTLRGSGSGQGLATGVSPGNGGSGTFVVDSTATQLYYGNTLLGFGPVLRTNLFGSPNTTTNYLLASDAIQGTNQCTLASAPAGGFTQGQIVRIDQYTSYFGEFVTTSSSSVTIPSSGTATFTVGSGLSITTGHPVTCVTTSGDNDNSFFTGNVSSYSGTTLVVNFAASPASINSHTGPFSQWTIYGMTYSWNSSALTIVSSGSATMTVASGLGLQNGMTVTAVSPRANAWMQGTVSSYSGTSLTISVVQSSGATGTYTPLGNADMWYLSGSPYPRGGNDAETYWSPNFGPPAGSERNSNSLSDRTIVQHMEVYSYNSSTKTLTFTTPFRRNYCAGTGVSSSGVWSGQATLYVYGTCDSTGTTLQTGVGIEDMQVSFGTPGGEGNITLQAVAYSWFRNVEAYWGQGGNGIEYCFRCEIRDSFLHETPSPFPGGGGYLLDVSSGSSDCLVENDAHWCGNKIIVGQTSGTGNVIAYNYLDDAYNANDPGEPEAGVNMAHCTTSNFDLMEGNYTHRYAGDSFWGGVTDHTIYRNWITGLRAKALTLNTTSFSPNTYQDGGFRSIVDNQAGCYRANFVGNVIGFSGVPLISTQTSFTYETLSYPTLDINNDFSFSTVYMYVFGAVQRGGYDSNSGYAGFDSQAYSTLFRSGNYHWMGGGTNGTAALGQIWYANIGDTGTTSTGTSATLPNSLYIPNGGPPAFWSGTVNPMGGTTTLTPSGISWPPFNPSNGSTTKLPQHQRFESISGLTIPPGNQ